MLELGHFYRLTIRGRDVDIPRAKYLGRYRFDWVPVYRGPEPDETLEWEWFTYVKGAEVMWSILPEDILEAEDVT